MKRTIALTAALAGALLLAWTGTKTPGPKPVSATPVATAFQTDLAMVDIHRIGRVPHPGGSAENAGVRDYLVGRMTALGLEPQRQDGMAIESRAFGGETWLVGGQVQNIVGVLPGRDRSKPALALMAHYDSVPGSPGAADDATGVAVILDIARAVKARGTPARDIIVIITDGEEAGLLGARRFFHDHPLKKRIGLLINLEARGGGGRANMFQTGPGNGALIPVFAQSAVSPISNSLAVFLYETMPNDTDFTVSNAAGIRGLNFAFIGRQFDYHSATSTPANLDQGSVRHMGEQALAATLALAFTDTLPGKAPDAVYSQTFGDHILAYPAWGGWIVLLIAAGLIGLAVARGRKTDTIRLIDAARGAGAALFLLVVGALLLHLARRATGVEFGFMGQRPLLAQWTLWETALSALGVGLLLLVPNLQTRSGLRLWLAGGSLIAGLLCSLFGGWDIMGAGLGLAAALLGYAAFGKPSALPGAWLGVLLTGLVAALALQILLPAVGFLIAWPLVLAGLGAAATLMGTRLDLSRTTALAILAALGGGWLAVFFHGVAQGLDLPAILGLFLWLGGFLLWPLAWPSGRWPKPALAPAVGFLALGLVLLLVVRFSDPWSPRYPQATQVLHVRDEITGKTWIAAQTPDLDPWSRKALGAGGGKIGKVDLRPVGRRPVWAVADRPGVPGNASVTLERRADGRIQINLPPASVVLLRLTVPSGFHGTVQIDDQSASLALEDASATPVTPAASRTLGVRLAGVPAPHQLILPAMSRGTLELRYALVDGPWPADARPLPSRPSEVMAFDLSDSAVRTGRIKTSW
ncbi:MAG: M20/M25/M40 family metallo-hydrolase [Caulobacter sp.]|nr:M20/M25/M40 family metallo-hydrolase [Caulobacter sp.]